MPLQMTGGVTQPQGWPELSTQNDDEEQSLTPTQKLRYR